MVIKSTYVYDLWVKAIFTVESVLAERSRFLFRSSYFTFQEDNRWEFVEWVFTGWLSCHVIHLPVSEQRRDTKHCAYPLAGIILCSSTTRLLVAGALLSLCHLSDVSTCAWAVIDIWLFVIARLLYKTLLLLFIRNMLSHLINIPMMSSNERYFTTVFYRP